MSLLMWLNYSQIGPEYIKVKNYNTSNPAPGVIINCGSFASHEEANDFFVKNGGPEKDTYNLDRDRDGEVCESLK